jgi:hypothetical protein
MIRSEFDSVLHDADIRLAPVALGALWKATENASASQFKKALEVIFTNSARTRRPTSNEIVAAVRGVVAEEHRYSDGAGPRASAEETAASTACIKALFASKTSAERAKILCEYADQERAAGRPFSAATEALLARTVQTMFDNAEKEAQRLRPPMPTLGEKLAVEMTADEQFDAIGPSGHEGNLDRKGRP